MTSRVVVAGIVLSMAMMFGEAQSDPSSKAKIHVATHGDDGERLFQANCGRCHRPPDQLSPKAAGSVLRHMRVRAMLSKEDEQQILKYLAP